MRARLKPSAATLGRLAPPFARVAFRCRFWHEAGCRELKDKRSAQCQLGRWSAMSHSAERHSPVLATALRLLQLGTAEMHLHIGCHITFRLTSCHPGLALQVGAGSAAWRFSSSCAAGAASRMRPPSAACSTRSPAAASGSAPCTSLAACRCMFVASPAGKRARVRVAMH